jgi:hypothetical protein
MVGHLLENFENRKDCLTDSYTPYILKYFLNDWNSIKEEVFHVDVTFESLSSVSEEVKPKEEEISLDSFEFFSESDPKSIDMVS